MRATQLSNAAPDVVAPGHRAARWWMTLATDGEPLSHLHVTAAALREFAATLRARDQERLAALVGQVAREVALAEAAQRLRSPINAPPAERYVWAFGRMADALIVFHANHRSDYHLYPEPQSIREASLHRLVERFPLGEYTRTSALLFTGIGLCSDPRLRADPRSDSAAAALPTLISPEDWDRYTCCGFREGVTLARVSPSARWLRVSLRDLEDAWAGALAAVGAANERQIDTPRLVAAERLARDTLLRSATAISSAS